VSAIHDPRVGASRRPPFAGLLLIALGGLFLAGTLGAIDIGGLIRRWWPALLVLVGLERLLLASSHHAGGITLIAIGSVMLAFTLGGLPWDWIGRFWPVILIVVGLWIVLKSRR
jgi:lia operon protein LiaF